MRSLAVALLFVGAEAAAQVLPDGGFAPCAQDSDCGACGWVCSPETGTCAAAAWSTGSCAGDTGCACPGQTCSGQSGDADFCLPTFQIQCLCDSDCATGQICNSWTHACQTATSSCTYGGQCDCGSVCANGKCVAIQGNGGCTTGPRVCLSNISDGGLVNWDAGAYLPYWDGGPVPDGGVDAGIYVNGTFCQQAGGSCGGDAQCCGGYCLNTFCGCREGTDPGQYYCQVDGDCCSPAVCSANLCYLDAGGWLVGPTSGPYGTSDGGSDGGSGKHPFSCASGGGPENLPLALVLTFAIAAGALRRRTAG